MAEFPQSEQRAGILLWVLCNRGKKSNDRNHIVAEFQVQTGESKHSQKDRTVESAEFVPFVLSTDRAPGRCECEGLREAAGTRPPKIQTSTNRDKQDESDKP